MNYCSKLFGLEHLGVGVQLLRTGQQLKIPDFCFAGFSILGPGTSPIGSGSKFHAERRYFQARSSHMDPIVPKLGFGECCNKKKV